MKQIAAVRDKDVPKFLDEIENLIFNWAKTCSGIRERIFAVMTAVRAAEGGKFRLGDLVTVGYNAQSNQVILAAAGRSRIVVEVSLDVEESKEIVKRLSWEIDWIEIPDDADGKFQKCPWEWLSTVEAVRAVSR